MWRRSPAASATATPVLDLDYAEDSDGRHRRQFRHDRHGRHRRNPGHGREDARSARSSSCAPDGAGAQGHRRAGRAAEAGGDVSERGSSRCARAASPASARDRDAQSRQARRDSRAARAATAIDARVGRRSGPARAGRDRHELSRRTRASRRRPRRRRPACRRSPTIPGSRSMRSAARPASIRRAGPGRQGFRAWRCSGSRRSCSERGAHEPGTGARISSARCALAWPDGHAESFEGRVDGTLVWPPRGERGFGYDPMFLPDGHRPHLRRDESEEKHGLPPAAAGFRTARGAS